MTATNPFAEASEDGYHSAIFRLDINHDFIVP